MLSLYGIVGIVENSEIYFNKNYTGINIPQILVEHDGSLTVGNEVLFWGFDDENQVEIEGSCTLGAHDIFSANEDVRWVALNISNQTEDYEIATCLFTNCDVNASCLSLEVSASEFTYSCIDFSYGNLLVQNECLFTHANITASSPGVTNLINIDNCSFMNTVYPNGSCIELNYCNSFLINNCTIQHDYHSDGIGIFNSGTVQIHERLIKNCVIYYPPSKTGTFSDGIRVYNSTANIENNYIHDNGYGIVLYDNATSYITGDQYASTENKTQRIKNNDLSQVTKC